MAFLSFYDTRSITHRDTHRDTWETNPEETCACLNQLNTTWLSGCGESDSTFMSDFLSNGCVVPTVPPTGTGGTGVDTGGDIDADAGENEPKLSGYYSDSSSRVVCSLMNGCAYIDSGYVFTYNNAAEQAQGVAA